MFILPTEIPYLAFIIHINLIIMVGFRKYNTLVKLSFYTTFKSVIIFITTYIFLFMTISLYFSVKILVFWGVSIFLLYVLVCNVVLILQCYTFVILSYAIYICYCGIVDTVRKDFVLKIQVNIPPVTNYSGKYTTAVHSLFIIF